MNEMAITNETLHQLLQEINMRLGRIETRMDRLENQQMEDRKLLMDLWKDRDEVKIKFSRTLFGVNATISMVVAIIVSLFTRR
jgi:hypothetical protein